MYLYTEVEISIIENTLIFVPHLRLIHSLIFSFLCSFRTLFDPTLSKKGPGYSTDYRRSGQRPDTGKRIGRVGGIGGSSEFIN